MLHKVRQRHHEVVEHVGPHIDAGHYLLVNQCLLKLVGRLVRALHRELFDLGQLAGKGAVVGAALLRNNTLLLLLLCVFVAAAGWGL